MTPGLRWLRRRLQPCLIAALLVISELAACAAHGAYAIAQYGEPKYAQGFSHFDYVNPDAPKGGTLTLANPSRLTSFDKFNPFTLRGNVAPGVDLMFETLMAGSADELASAYGLLADDVQIAPDRLCATFHLNPKARFSNGDPVQAEDVKYSFDTLKSPLAAPQFAAVFGDITRAVVVDAATVRFEFKRPNRELPLLAGSVPVFSRKWGMRADGSRIPFDQLAFETPIASGPYLIERYDNGRTITLKRDPHYWAAGLPVRRGMYNFERITYKLYADSVAKLEAFKAGEFDVNVEYIARQWVRGYVGKRFRSGELVKREFRHHNSAGMQGFVVNTRRALFRDVRVRHALNLALDFEWLNRQLFYGQYTRLNSYFANGALAARAMPDAAELAILTPLRAQLDPAVFGPLPAQPVTAPPPHSLRANLIQARELLAQAGWTYRDGALRARDGTPFEFEIIDDSGGGMAQVAAPYIRNLQKLGIRVVYRQLDYAVLQKRLDAFDFDMTSLRYPDVEVPGSEQLARFGSRAADEPGSDNLFGLKSPAVDAILHALLAARTMDELVAASRALDRVLLHGYYVVPQWYSSVHRIAYRCTLAYPRPGPPYYTAEEWVRSLWWQAPQERPSSNDAH
ncbi:ABC transporter substrate-binding protein [Mycetohabitans endofungorum]|uniref:extracellular solute-binding protein n=1 Tax=Mycetohabitans endofungorum TaxID=417203 RepID=UPI0030D5A13B